MSAAMDHIKSRLLLRFLTRITWPATPSISELNGTPKPLSFQSQTNFIILHQKQCSLPDSDSPPPAPSYRRPFSTMNRPFKRSKSSLGLDSLHDFGIPVSSRGNPVGRTLETLGSPSALLLINSTLRWTPRYCPWSPPVVTKLPIRRRRRRHRPARSCLPILFSRR
jgi:hypothetical protein